jgi:hypothetical protein
MHGMMDYEFWLLRRDELLSEAAGTRLAQQGRNGRSTLNPFHLFATSKFFTARDLRRQTP